MENQYIYYKRLGVTFSVNISEDIKNQILASHKEFRMFNQLKIGVAFKNPSDNHCKKIAREVSDKNSKLEIFMMERVDISRDGKLVIFSVDEIPPLGEIENRHENSWVSKLMEFRGYNHLLYRLAVNLKPYVVVDSARGRVWFTNKNSAYNYYINYNRRKRPLTLFYKIKNFITELW